MPRTASGRPCASAIAVLAVLPFAQLAETLPAQTRPAQGLPTQARAVSASGRGHLDFRSPDGSRFVLLPGDGPGILHWVIATPAGPLEDPPGLEGLSIACAQSSLAGTFRSGSLDAAAERRALADLDAANLALLTAPRDGDRPPTELLQRRDSAQAAAAALADPGAFLRALAHAGATDVRVSNRRTVCLLSLTTVPDAVAEVGALLLERREQAALRSFEVAFDAVRALDTAAFDADPLAALRAEVMALAFPGHPLARFGERPGTGPVSRAQAEAVWRRTQAPSRSVHVLTGRFAANDVRTVLERTFAHSELGAPPPPPQPPMRSTAMRRSTVPGPKAAVAVAWPLTGNEDRRLLQAAGRWLGGGTASFLGRELTQAGRTAVRVECRVPWPEGVTAGGLLLLEVLGDGPDEPGLADRVLRLCRDASRQQPSGDEVEQTLRPVLEQWNAATRSPRSFAERIAADLILWPATTLPPEPPRPVEPKAMLALLEAILQRQPVVVEARP